MNLTNKVRVIFIVSIIKNIPELLTPFIKWLLKEKLTKKVDDKKIIVNH